jgi:multiple sugar transport system permease protein
MKARVREMAWTYGLLSPWLVTLPISFGYIPLRSALYISFTKVITLSGESSWVGLGNYADVFRDRLFWVALQNTCVFAVGTVPVTTVLALFLALAFLNSVHTRWKDAIESRCFCANRDLSCGDIAHLYQISMHKMDS